MKMLQRVTTLFSISVCMIVFAASVSAEMVEIDDFTDQTLTTTTVFSAGGFSVDRSFDDASAFTANGSGTGFDLLLLSGGGTATGTISYEISGGTFGDLVDFVYAPGFDATGFLFGYALKDFGLGGGVTTFGLDFKVGGGPIVPVDLTSTTTPFTWLDSAIDGATTIDLTFTVGDSPGFLAVGTTPFAVTAAIPEPTSLMLFGSLAGLALIRRRNR